MATFIPFFLLLLLSFSSPTFVSTSSSTSFFNALEVLSSSGYLSMALTLEITSKSFNLDSSAATIFAPHDPAFSHSGQLSLLQLFYHISPTRLPMDALKTLSFGSKIPTLLANQSLTVTSLNGQVSINGVLVQESLIFDDGSIVVYGTRDFFNFSSGFGPSFLVPSPSPALIPRNGDEVSGFSPFHQASELLVSRGYSSMAAFLDVQLFGYENQSRLTIFAPVDQALEANAKNVTELSSIFRQHAVPGLLSWQDLVGFPDGTSLQTFSGGFLINVTKSGDVLVLNGVPLVFADIYFSKKLIVHGINRLLIPVVKKEFAGDFFMDFTWENEQSPPDYVEYGAR